MIHVPVTFALRMAALLRLSEGRCEAHVISEEDVRFTFCFVVPEEGVTVYYRGRDPEVLAPYLMVKFDERIHIGAEGAMEPQFTARFV